VSADEQQVQRIAEDIVVGHARHRRRARWAVGAGAGIAVAAAVPLAIVLYRPVTAGRPITMREQGTRQSTHIAQSASIAPRYATPAMTTDDADIYAAVLRDWQPFGALRVFQRVCNSEGVCSAGAETADLRRQLIMLLGARLHFLAHEPGAIQLQGVRVRGNVASVRIEDGCGPMCLSGERVQLARAGASWRLSGDAVRWIS
jgi:hypothetical protein